MVINMATIAREHNAVRSSGQALAAGQKAAALGRQWLPRARSNDLRQAMANLDSLMVGWRSMGPDRDVSGQWPTARRVVERVYVEINGIAGVEQRLDEVSFTKEVIDQTARVYDEAVKVGEGIADAGRAVGATASKVLIAVVVVLVLVVLVKRS